MYIPSSFFGSQGSCITATTTSITGSGGVSTGSFISGGLYWQYYAFENSANVKLGVSSSFVLSLNILSGSTGQAKLLVVGGGGGGGFNPGDSCINPYIDTIGSAGGGGGGGVVYYNQFSLSSGSYEISVGAGGYGADLLLSNRIGGNGSVSYFKNKSYEYTPFTSSFITAYGGGGGAGNTNNCIGAGYGLGNTGASSGGGSQTAIASDFVPAVAPYGYTGGVPPVIQGSGAGSMTGSPYANDRAMGGGGAATSSANITDTYNPFAGSPAGDGLFYNLTGTALGFGAGGGGVRWTNTGTGVLTGNGAGWGNAGSGGTGGFGGRFSIPRGSEPGLNGIVIIAWPICSSNFSCKTFDITGSTGTLSYLPCNLPYVTQSKASSPSDYFSACLLTWSGSNTPILLEGETTASVGGECGNQFTQSFSCNCTYIRAVAGSGTQTLTYFPCNGTSNVTTTVGTGGGDFCIENLSRPTLTGVNSAITYYGNCKAGTTCTGIQYTSSIVNCSSVLATAGGSGATLTYLPCGTNAAISVALSGSESMSICTGLTSSFLDLTGIGSTLQTLGTCSVTFPPLVNWKYTETGSSLYSIDGTFTIYDNATTLATLTSNGSGNSEVSQSHYVTASLTPVNYPLTGSASSGSVAMNIRVTGATTLSVSSSTNTTISASFLVAEGGRYTITGSIVYTPPLTTYNTCSCLSYRFTAGTPFPGYTYEARGIMYCGSATSGSAISIPRGTSKDFCVVSQSAPYFEMTGPNSTITFLGTCTTASCA